MASHRVLLNIHHLLALTDLKKSSWIEVKVNKLRTRLDLGGGRGYQGVRHWTAYPDIDHSL